MEILQGVWGAITDIVSNSGYAYFFTADGGYKNLIMIVMAFIFLYLGIKKGFEFFQLGNMQLIAAHGIHLTEI